MPSPTYPAPRGTSADRARLSSPVGAETFNKLKVLDLFSGTGAFSLGLERTGAFETVAFCDNAPASRRVLAKHWPEVPCYHDIRDLSADRLRADGISIDAICGGFPCQDLSYAGKGAGIGGQRSGLWKEFARLIKETSPALVLIENVSAIVRRGLDRVLRDLAESGFDAEWGPIPARFVGAPHNRPRTWIIAYPIGSQRGEEPYLRSVGRMGREQQSFPWDRNWEVALREFRRVDDGSAYRVDRVDLLRNGIVPQIPELIGRAILSSLGVLSSHRPVKLEGCVNPTAAPLQTIAALGAQARDDLFHDQTNGNSFFHGEHNV